MNVNTLKNQFNELTVCYKEGLSHEGGFLPKTIPGATLPSSFNYYLEVLNDLATIFVPHKDTSIREWLHVKLLHYNYKHALSDTKTLNYNQLNHALSIFSILMQSYRWDKLPAEAPTFSLTQLSFPDALYQPWKALSDIAGLPHANTYWAVIACNWKLKNNKSGHRYKNEELNSSEFQLLYTWLPAPYQSELEEFILSFVEMEARGALALKSMLNSIQCAIQDDSNGMLFELTQLKNHIKSMNSVFSKRIRKNKIALDNWRDIIHVPFAWGLIDANGEKLEGASGMQIGVIAALNSFLSIPETSNIGKATRHSRMYLLPQQRQFLSALDKFNPFVKEYVRNSNNLAMIDAFNACIASLLRWRVSHQKRGEMYLSHNIQEDTPQIATGLTLPQNDNQVNIAQLFAKDMEERIQETKDATIEAT